jgi:mannose-1-phosphate guanylyltransferase
VKFKKLILEQLPELKPSQLIIEPVARDTAPAIGLIAYTLFKKDPKAIIATIASDHAIGSVREFSSTLNTALKVCSQHPDKVITLGIQPNNPDTGYGYIQKGRHFMKDGTHDAYFIKNFKEKPDEKTAIKYLKNGNYLWNAGYFIFSAETMKEHFNTYINETSKKIASVVEPGKKALPLSRAQAIFKRIKAEAIDTALMEKLPSNKRLVVPTPLEWSDIGNWKSLVNFIQTKKKNSTRNHIDHLGKNCYARTSENKIIATIGLKDVVIIDTRDALLVADIHKAHEVKQIISELKKKKKKDCL